MVTEVEVDGFAWKLEADAVPGIVLFFFFCKFPYGPIFRLKQNIQFMPPLIFYLRAMIYQVVNYLIIRSTCMQKIMDLNPKA